jgi:hypothetical protein
VTIRDSISSGLTVVGPGSAKGEGTLTNARFEKLTIVNSGIGGSPHHDLWIRKDAFGSVSMLDSPVADILNDSEHFELHRP